MDHTELGRRIKAKRTHDGLSLQQVELMTGISDSVLSHIENGNRQYLQQRTLSNLLRWLADVPEGAICYFPARSLPDIVDDLLLADFSISDDAAVSLMEKFRSAYDAAVEASR
jgi:transcriptional regulator with XRE-family HTH domain